MHCEYAVRLLQVEEQKGLGMILVMEICDCDLEDYLKKTQITEPQFRRYISTDNIILFPPPLGTIEWPLCGVSCIRFYKLYPVS